MLELGVFSEDKHFTGMMLLKRRNLQAGPVIVGLNGAASVVGLERIGRVSRRRKLRRERAGIP